MRFWKRTGCSNQQTIDNYRQNCRRFNALFVCRITSWLAGASIFFSLTSLILYKINPRSILLLIAEVLFALSFSGLFILYFIILPMIRWRMGILFAPKIQCDKTRVQLNELNRRELRDYIVSAIEDYESHRIETQKFAVLLEPLFELETDDSLVVTAAVDLWDWFADLPNQPAFDKDDLSMLTSFKLALKTDCDIELIRIEELKSDIRWRLTAHLTFLAWLIICAVLVFILDLLPFAVLIISWVLCGIASCGICWMIPCRYDKKNSALLNDFGIYGSFNSYSEISQVMRKYGIRKRRPEKKCSVKTKRRIGLHGLFLSAIGGGFTVILNILNTLQPPCIMKLKK